MNTVMRQPLPDRSRRRRAHRDATDYTCDRPLPFRGPGPSGEGKRRVRRPAELREGRIGGGFN